MRREVQTFVAEGPLPNWDPGEEEIDRRVTQLEAITKPMTGEETAALVSCFGPDDCHGVAWTLLHLIEAGPNPALDAKPAPDANEWHHRLYDRAVVEGGPSRRGVHE
ncbi:hypothetical protein ACWGFX_06795 [Streptomyces xanthophaeus]